MKRGNITPKGGRRLFICLGVKCPRRVVHWFKRGLRSSSKSTFSKLLYFKSWTVGFARCPKSSPRSHCASTSTWQVKRVLLNPVHETIDHGSIHPIRILKSLSKFLQVPKFCMEPAWSVIAYPSQGLCGHPRYPSACSHSLTASNFSHCPLPFPLFPGFSQMSWHTCLNFTELGRFTSHDI